MDAVAADLLLRERFHRKLDFRCYPELARTSAPPCWSWAAAPAPQRGIGIHRPPAVDRTRNSRSANEFPR